MIKFKIEDFKIKNHFFTLLIILIIAFLVRSYNLSFPFFDPEEARVSARGYFIATSGKDELGRLFPLVFNSASDYQLPVVSYLSSLGSLALGRNDFGSRLPFILVALFIVFLTYKVAEIFNNKKEFQLVAALIVSLSPGIIFFSRTPNEFIVLTFGVLLIFYLLNKKDVNTSFLSLSIIFTLAISKISWLVTIPFVIFSLAVFRVSLAKKNKMKITIVTILLTSAVIFIFLRIPQATRSLFENEFQIVQDPNTKVILDRLRGQGLESGWPNYIEKIIFNKLQIINLSLLNWLSHLEPAVLFGRFNGLGSDGFMGLGAFPKILIMPFITGLIFISRSNDRKLRSLFLMPFILTFPILFIYPKYSYNSILMSLPFIALIIAFGFMNFNKIFKISLIIIMILEVIINISNVAPDIKAANSTRPIWIKPVVEESYNLSLSNKIAISDNLVSDIGPYLSWLSAKPIQSISKDIQFPYKFRETEFPNITILGADDNSFYMCGLNKPKFVFASKRDYEKLQKWLNIDATEKPIEKIFSDSFNNQTVYLIYLNKCLN